MNGVAVPNDPRHRLEPQPDHFAPSTWRLCLATGCMNRVDPWEHNMRCPDHRRTVTELAARHIDIVTADTVRQTVATATLYDVDYPARLLDAIMADAPNLVARIIVQLQRQARHG